MKLTDQPLSRPNCASRQVSRRLGHTRGTKADFRTKASLSRRIDAVPDTLTTTCQPGEVDESSPRG